MKLSKIRFARVIAFIERVHALNMHEDEIEALDNIIDVEVPEQEIHQIYPKNENVERLMMLMAEGTRKIEAIKEHRCITGMGLKDSKDAVERYWPGSAEKMTKQKLTDKLLNMNLPLNAHECISAFLSDCFDSK